METSSKRRRYSSDQPSAAMEESTIESQKYSTVEIVPLLRRDAAVRFQNGEPLGGAPREEWCKSNGNSRRSTGGRRALPSESVGFPTSFKVFRKSQNIGSHSELLAEPEARSGRAVSGSSEPNRTSLVEPNRTDLSKPSRAGASKLKRTGSPESNRTGSREPNRTDPRKMSPILFFDNSLPTTEGLLASPSPTQPKRTKKEEIILEDDEEDDVILETQPPKRSRLSGEKNGGKKAPFRRETRSRNEKSVEEIAPSSVKRRKK